MQGTVLGGKYRLLRQMAEGGMGVVWEAEHVDIGRRLAVKLLSGQLSGNPEAALRFRREAQVAGTLGHDHICPVLDVGAHDGQHYLVMELLRGRSLGETLKAEGALAVGRALDIAAQILDALGAAHSAGVVHRDLKPENVFLSRVGDRDDFVRVLDFGISKISTEGGEGGKALTRTGIVMGTPQYMAPEQARGKRDVDLRADLYATGAILYEMLTGRLAYDGESANEVVIKVATEPFVPPRVHRPELPAEVEAIVMRAMARDREERFRTAAEMQDEVLRARALPLACEPTRVSSPRPAPAAGPSDTFEEPRAGAEPESLAWRSTLLRTSTPLTAVGDSAQIVPPPARSRALLVAAALAVLATAAGIAIWLAGDGRGGAAVQPLPDGAANAALPPAPPTVPAASGPAAGPVAPPPTIGAPSTAAPPIGLEPPPDLPPGGQRPASPRSAAARPPRQRAGDQRPGPARSGAPGQRSSADAAEPRAPSRGPVGRDVPDLVRDGPARDVDIVR